MFSGNCTWGATICRNDVTLPDRWLYSNIVQIQGNKRPLISSGVIICSIRPSTASHSFPNPLGNRGATTSSSTPGRATAAPLSHRCPATPEDPSWGSTTAIVWQGCQLVQRVFLLSVLTCEQLLHLKQAYTFDTQKGEDSHAEITTNSRINGWNCERHHLFVSFICWVERQILHNKAQQTLHSTVTINHVQQALLIWLEF